MSQSDEGARTENSGTLTTKAFWDHIWQPNRNDKRRSDRTDRIRHIYAINRVFGDFLVVNARRVMPADRPIDILEVGCANSVWMPFLAEQLNSNVVGVDYSEEGCRLAEQNLASMNLSAEVVRDDFFTFADRETRKFDLVTSFGLIEHFSDPTIMLAPMVSLLRPGGMVLATIPNLSGIYGRLQEFVDGKVLAMHTLMDSGQLTKFAEKAGLNDIEAGYTGGLLGLRLLNFSHVNWLPAGVSRRLGVALAEIDTLAQYPLQSARLGRGQAYTAPYVYVLGFQVD